MNCKNIYEVFCKVNTIYIPDTFYILEYLKYKIVNTRIESKNILSFEEFVGNKQKEIKESITSELATKILNKYNPGINYNTTNYISEEEFHKFIEGYEL